MKALGIFLIFLALVMSANIVAGLARHDPKVSVEIMTFLTPLIVLICGVAALRKAKSAKVKKDGFSL